MRIRMEAAARIVEVEADHNLAAVIEVAKGLWLFVGDHSPGPAPAGFQAELSTVDGGDAQ